MSLQDCLNRLLRLDERTSDEDNPKSRSHHRGGCTQRHGFGLFILTARLADISDHDRSRRGDAGWSGQQRGC